MDVDASSSASLVSAEKPIEREVGYRNNYGSSNWGLKGNARTLEDALFNSSGRPSLWSQNSASRQLEYAKLCNQKAVTPSAETDWDESPYAGIDIEQIWGLPDNIFEIPLHPPLLETLRSRRLKIYAHSVQEDIHKFHSITKVLFELLELLMGDNTVDGQFADDLPKDVVVSFSKLVLDNLNACCDFEDTLSSIYNLLIKAHIQKKYLMKALFVNRALKKKSRLLINPASVTCPPRNDDYLFPIGYRISPNSSPTSTPKQPQVTPSLIDIEMSGVASLSDSEDMAAPPPKKPKTGRIGRPPVKVGASAAKRPGRKPSALTSSPKTGKVGVKDEDTGMETIPPPPPPSSTLNATRGILTDLAPQLATLPVPPPPFSLSTTDEQLGSGIAFKKDEPSPVHTNKSSSSSTGSSTGASKAAEFPKVAKQQSPTPNPSCPSPAPAAPTPGYSYPSSHSAASDTLPHGSGPSDTEVASVQESQQPTATEGMAQSEGTLSQQSQLSQPPNPPAPAPILSVSTFASGSLTNANPTTGNNLGNSNFHSGQQGNIASFLNK